MPSPHHLIFPLAATALLACGSPHGPGCPAPARPSARTGFDAILTPDTGDIYVFGGATSTTTDAPNAELWRYSLVNPCTPWTHLLPPSSPRAVTAYAADYDSSRTRLIVTGGVDALGTAIVDTWAFDTSQLTWTQLFTVGDVPLPRGGRVAAYDASADRLLLVGDVAYELDFGKSSQGSWQPLVAAGMPPSPRVDAAGALDPTRSLLLLFGGNADSGGLTNELWAYNLSINTWWQVTTTGSLPSPRAGARMRWDAQDKVLLLFGGRDADGARGDLFTIALDGNGRNATFKSVIRSSAVPSPRANGGLIVSGDLLWLSGGDNGACLYDDVWTLPLDGTAWTRVLAASTCP